MIRALASCGYNFLRLIVFSLILVSLLYLLQRYLLRLSVHNDTTGAGHRPSQTPTSMSLTRAAEILDLPEDASETEIVSAHRRLMQKLHPDKGGSPALARDLNEAKLVMMKSRR